MSFHIANLQKSPVHFQIQRKKWSARVQDSKLAFFYMKKYNGIQRKKIQGIVGISPFDQLCIFWPHKTVFVWTVLIFLFHSYWTEAACIITAFWMPPIQNGNCLSTSHLLIPEELGFFFFSFGFVMEHETWMRQGTSWNWSTNSGKVWSTTG